MNIGIILDPLDALRVYKDSTVAIMEAAQARGHALWVMQAGDVFMADGQVAARARRLHLTGDAINWHQLAEAEERPLAGFDAVLNRKDPPFDIDYVTLTWLLAQAAANGACVLNAPEAVLAWNEKIAISRFPQFTAPTLVSRQAEWLRDFIARHRDAILKPLTGMGGAGVFRVRDGDPNVNVIIETLTDNGAHAVMAQRYIPEIRDGDKRILIIDGEPVPWALARIPSNGETRGNLAAGGRGEVRPLSPRDREIAETLGPALKRAGLFLVGLDVIGDWLTEVNVTSPTGMREIFHQTGFSAAQLFVERLEALKRARGGSDTAGLESS